MCRWCSKHAFKIMTLPTHVSFLLEASGFLLFVYHLLDLCCQHYHPHHLHYYSSHHHYHSSHHHYHSSHHHYHSSHLLYHWVFPHPHHFFDQRFCWTPFLSIKCPLCLDFGPVAFPVSTEDFQEVLLLIFSL